ncbi:hypothetical protein LUZ61_016683 [Rhynchospora tenuis]|uniref:Uncharacterized protein n=1 Tax=Rhynchospora tenuis TaxID=198213 RepID=A0AAD5Z5Y4_9POAL|nr:hypothetical protein LUZ61_016683 [Rhynchospora tenuis]
MGLGGVFSNLLYLGAQLITAVGASPDREAPSSSSYPHPWVESNQIENELKELMRLLKRIKAMLYDAEEREIRDRSVKLWLQELSAVAYDAEDVLDEYRFEVLRAQVEATHASASPKIMLIQVSYAMLEQIKQIRSKFDEIAKDRIALQFFEEDGPRRFNSDMQITPTSHFVVESDIIGREWEKQKLINLLSSESQDAQIISVVTIVGTGGIGKTTLAQLIYNDQIIRRKFDKLGWVCLSEDFNVQRLTREVIESITRSSCGLTNLSALQEYISEEIRGKRIFLVLDDAWNENRSHWELFRAPFKSASLVKVLVTTRNESVAKIMQTLPTFNLGYMSEEKSWQMFQHYAFGEVIHNTSSNLEEIGKHIMKKCGMLPLAIKSIASLLRHERKEESWREILENELWKSDACTEIFRPLQISYARLPTYLKPCFLYCSMFPRDYRYSAKELVQLWIYQGYVQTDEFENAEKVGWEYAKQLWQRSFFEGRYEEKEFNFRLHDMVHDLARWNSGHGCHFIEGDIAPNFPKQLYHLYVDQWEELVEPPPFPSRKFATLRTLIMSHWVKSLPSDFNFSEAQKLRALKLAPNVYLEPDFSFVNFKHLRYLSLYGKCFERLPECICSLYNLKNLTLKDCPHLKELPKDIANLVSLEELAIYASDLRVLPTSLCELKALRKLYLENCSKFVGFPPNMRNLVSLEELTIMECDNLEMLPLSFCQLKALRELNLSGCCALEELPHDMGNLANLQILRVLDTNVRSLPPTLNEIIRMLALEVSLYCKTIGWLEHFADLEGTLILSGLSCVPSLKDVHCANLASMHRLQRLILTWVDDHIFHIWDKNVLHLCIDGDGDASSEIDLDDPPCSLMVCLQPHPNLKELKVEEYPGLAFPYWIKDPTLCSSLKSIELVRCELITLLPFGSLDKLKYLKVEKCYSLQFIHEESLPLVLEEIEISDCRGLISVTGIKRLKSLVKLEITSCGELHLLDHCWDPETCIIIVSRCPKLSEWCSEHNIYYEGSKSDEEAGSNLHELEIKHYIGHLFPDWIGNPTICIILKSIKLIQCKFITILPFGSLDKLKYLRISGCSSLQFIHEESLPLALEEIEISHCQSLISVSGINRLKSLVKLEITICKELCFLDHCQDMEMCIITVSWCPKLREWCLQHDIDYHEGAELDDCGTKLLPDVNEYSLQASSSSSARAQYHQIIVKLKQLLKLLHSRIWTLLCDANMRKMNDNTMELWLEELCNLWYCTDHVFVKYIDEVLQEQVKATDFSPPISHIRGLIEVLDGVLSRIQLIQQIRSKFDEKDRSLRLLEEDIVLYVLRPCYILIDGCEGKNQFLV